MLYSMWFARQTGQPCVDRILGLVCVCQHERTLHLRISASHSCLCITCSVSQVVLCVCAARKVPAACCVLPVNHRPAALAAR